MKTVASVIPSAFSAYAFSFAVDLLAGGVMRPYPATASLPGTTWSALAVVAVLAAMRLKAAPWTLWAPFALFMAIALAGAVVGRHAQNWVVAAFMVLQTLLARRAARPQAETRLVAGPA